jgi:copper chaperone NosL
LADAAPNERMLAGYGVAAIGVLTLAGMALAGKKLNKWVAVPAVAFPVVFLADSFYWLYSFGHDLDPKAPLRIGAFTPELFGNGQIGQFATFAQPAAGFWVALAGVALAVAANVVRSRVCTHCAQASECSLVCPRAMVLPDKARSAS